MDRTQSAAAPSRIATLDTKSLRQGRLSSLFARASKPLRLISVALAASAFALASLQVVAQSGDSKLIGDEYNKIVEQGQQFPALGSNLFGDQTSFYNGTTEFVTTDTSLPGNSALPVELTRRYSVQDRRGASPDGAFGDWDLDIPYIEGTFATGTSGGWQLQRFGGGETNLRCSRSGNNATGNPARMMRGTRWYEPTDYWHGYHLHIPSAGDQELLSLQGVNNTFMPTTGGPYYWATREQWYVSCGSANSATHQESGEGFVVLSPDGTRYTLNHFVYRNAPAIRSPSEPEQGNQTLVRKRILAYVTRVQDRFGNFVDYTWNGSQLTRIRGSSVNLDDVRTIDLTWTGGRVSSVTDGTRTWYYAYGTVSGRSTLTGVTQPDGTAWTINFGGLTNLAIIYNRSKQDASCRQPGSFAAVVKDARYSGTITHPSGATGEFGFKIARHWRSNHRPESENCAIGFPNITYDDVAYSPYSSDVFALHDKKISGLAIAPQEWQVRYASFPAGDGPCTDVDACAVTTLALGPDGDLDRYVHSNRVGADEGKLIRHDRGSGTLVKSNIVVGSILESVRMVYQLESHSFDSFPDRLGISPQFSPGSAVINAMEHFVAERILPMSRRSTERQGVTFLWAAGNFDASALPSTVFKYSQFGVRYEHSRTFLNDQGRWVIGLPTSMSSETADNEFEITYDTAGLNGNPPTLLPISESSFGRLVRTGTWNRDGTLQTSTDARGNRTRFQDYYRGIPQLVTYAEGTSEQATKQVEVNNIGRIMWADDEMGYRTSYEYDAEGRLREIRYPVNDTIAWNPTTITYSKITNAAYGLSAGHWRRTESTGDKRSISYYDALWRPVLEEQFDAANPSASRSLVRRAFDEQGRTVFQSYPVRSPPSGNYLGISNGTTTLIDSLDRPSSIQMNSELGLLTTRIEYLEGFLRRTTLPRDVMNPDPQFSQVTTESFQAFDTPDMSSVVQRFEPMGVTVEIDRDAWGKPLTITRWGSSGYGNQTLIRSFVYDGYQRLCKRIDPETKATFFDYDAADNLAWSATGVTQLQPTCDRDVVSANDKVTYTYDARNRRLRTEIVDEFRSPETFSHNIVNTYFADGALQSTTAQGSTWTYAYNKRRLPVSETVQIGLLNDSRTHALGWGYSLNGDLASASYPGGYAVSYYPDALGRPTAAYGSDGRTFASGVSYHPSGAVSGFFYGNGLVHSLTQNLRQLPSTSRSSLGVEAVLDYRLSYDANGNVTQIIDGTPEPLETRQSIAYDARDRLLSSYLPATKYGLALTETYAYDPLDNMRSLTISGDGISGTQTHVIDAATNLLTAITDGGAATLASYTYDARGNVLGRTRRIGATAQSLTYTHRFDQLNRMVTTYRVGDAVGGEEFTVYDGHGRRTSSDRRVNPAVPAYSVQVYSRAGELMYEEDERSPVNGAHPQSSNGKEVRHIYLAGSRIARQLTQIGGSQAQTLYAHTNPVRTTTVETDDVGQVVNTRQRLAPYGSPYSGDYHDRPGFTGHMTDDWSELTYMQQRYYDPVASRFISVDPVYVDTASGGNFNRYWYANNNPYAFIDPDGRMPACTPNCTNAQVDAYTRGTAGQLMTVVGGSAAVGASAGGGAVAVAALQANAPRIIFNFLMALDGKAGDVVAHAKAAQLIREGAKRITTEQTTRGVAVVGVAGAAAATSPAVNASDSTTEIDISGFKGVFRVEGRIDSRKLDEELHSK